MYFSCSGKKSTKRIRLKGAIASLENPHCFCLFTHRWRFRTLLRVHTCNTDGFLPVTNRVLLPAPAARVGYSECMLRTHCTATDGRPGNKSRKAAPHNEQQCQSEAHADKSVGNWFVGRQAKLCEIHPEPYRNDRRAVADTEESTSIRLKKGIPKGLAPGWRFAYFLDKEKVGRRRPTQINR